MDLNKLFSGEGVQIVNPNYTGKRDKKNPKYITLPATEENQSSLYSDALSSIPEYGNTFKDVDADKYERYGITISRPTLANIEDELAEAQSMFDKIGNSLAQTAGEIVIGGLGGIGTVAEAMWKAPIQFIDTLTSEVVKAFDETANTDPNRIRRALGITDNDYGNWWSNAFEDFKEKWNNEFFPIYAEKDASIANPSISWFLKGFPTVASTLSLLIPTRLVMVGVGKVGEGLSYVSKVAKINKNIKKAQAASTIAAAEKAAGITDETIQLSPIAKFLFNPTKQGMLKTSLAVGAEGTLMRTLENYQEAHQTFEEAYDEAINMSDDKFNRFVKENNDLLNKNEVDVTSKHEVAKFIAGQAADKTFLLDYMNLGFDIWQVAMLPRVGKFTRKAKGAAVKAEERVANQYVSNIAAAEGKQAATQALNTGVEEASRSTVGKVFNWAKNKIKDSAKLALVESTEGIEEIVNYYAQQEGATFGKTLYDKENVLTYKDRLKKYALDPAMWESGFWGVFGGVAFGAVHGKLNEYNIKKRNKKIWDAITKDLPDSMKKDLNIPDWVTMGLEPEAQAAVTAIRNRQNKIIDFITKTQKLNDEDINPFTGKKLEGDTEVEKTLIRSRLAQNFREGLAIDAINSGTYDSLVTWLSTPEIKKAFVNLGVLDESNADSFISQTLTDLENTKNIYYNELSRVNAAVTQLNSTRPITEQIPLEYVELIAEQNAKIELELKGLDKELEGLSALQPTFSTGEQELSEQSRQALKVAMVTQSYGLLEARIRKLESDEVKDREGNPISEWRKSQSIDALKSRQKALLDSLDDVFLSSDGTKKGTPAAKLGAMLYVIRNGKAYRMLSPLNLDNDVIKADDTVQDLNDVDFKATDEELIKKYELEDERFDNVTIGQQAKLYEDEIERLTGEEGLAKTNPRLFNLIADMTSVELSKYLKRSEMKTSVKAIREEVDILENNKNSIRREQIERASNIIVSLYNKYKDRGQEHIQKAIIEAYFNNRKKAYDLARTYLTDTDSDGVSDADNFIKALQIINFSNGANKMALHYINDAIDRSRQTTPPGEPKIKPVEKPKKTVTPHTGIKINGRIVNTLNGKRFDIKVNDEYISLQLSNIPGTTSYQVNAITQPEDIKYKLVKHSGLFNDTTGSITMENAKVQITNAPVIQIEDDDIYLETKGDAVISPVEEKRPDAALDDGLEEEPDDDGTDEAPDDDFESAEKSRARQIVESEVYALVSNDIEKLISDVSASPTYWNDFVTSKSAELANNADVSRYLSQDEITQALNGAIGEVKSILQSMGVSTGDELQDMARTTAVFSMFMDRVSPIFGDKFNSSIAQLFLTYCNKMGLRTYMDGKTTVRIISFRDILRLCCNVNGVIDKKEVTALAENIYAYIETVNKKSSKTNLRYKIVDINDYYSGDLFKYIDKTVAQIREIEGKNTENAVNEQRVKLLREDYLGNRQELERYDAWFASAKVNDELIVEDPGEGMPLIVYADPGDGKGRIVVAEIPRANNRGNGQYYKNNDGWAYDMSLDSLGNVVSPLQDALIDIFTSDDENCVKIREQLIRISTTTYNTKEARQKALEALGKFIVESDYLKEEIGVDKNGIPYTRGDKILYQHTKPVNEPIQVDGKTVYVNREKKAYDYDRIGKGILNLWNYNYFLRDSVDTEEGKTVIKNSVINWFAKLYDTYDSLAHVSEGEATVRISFLNKGAVSFITNKDNKNTAYEKMTYVRQGVANLGTARLAYAVGGQIVRSNPSTAMQGETNVVDKPGDVKDNASYIALFDPNTKSVNYARMYGCRLGEDEIRNSSIGKIGRQIETGLKEILEQLDDNLDKARRGKASIDLNLQAKLEDYIESIIATGRKNDRIPVFAPIGGGTVIKTNMYLNGFKTGVKFKYTYKGVAHEFKIFYYTEKNGRFYPNLGYQYFAGKNDDGTPKLISNGVHTKAGGVYRNLATMFIATSDKDKPGFIQSIGQINVGVTAIARDNNLSSPIANGFFRTNAAGNIVFKIRDGHEEEVYESYNQYIIENNLVKVNLKREDDGTNYKPKNDDENDQRANRVMKVDLITHRRTGSGDPNFIYQFSSSDVNDSVWTKINNLFNFGEVNQQNGTTKASVEEILKFNNREDIIQTIRKIERELGIDEVDSLLPNEISFDETLNVLVDQKDELGPIAVSAVDERHKTYDSYNKVNGEIVTTKKTMSVGDIIVGMRWINTIASKDASGTNIALRTLFHEKLHLKIHEKGVNTKAFYNELRDIYSKFKDAYNKAVAEGKVPQGISTEYIDNFINYYKNSPEEIVLEEFAVECMTSPSFFEMMNSIAETNVGDNTKESLFSRFLKFIMDLFGWNVEENTLNERYFNFLRTLGNESSQNPATTEEETETEESETNDEDEETNENEDEESETNDDDDDEPLAINLEDNNDDDLLIDDDALESFSIDKGYRNPDPTTIENSLPIELRDNFRNNTNNGWHQIRCK